MFEARSCAQDEEAVLVQRDWRADGGDRRVRVTAATFTSPGASAA